MTYRVELNAKAHEEFIEAYAWYESRSAGLGEKFAREVEAIIDVISKTPELHAIKKGKFREAKVSIFPYLIVYEVLKSKAIIHIAAIYHGKRNPKSKYRKRK